MVLSFSCAKGSSDHSFQSTVFFKPGNAAVWSEIMLPLYSPFGVSRLRGAGFCCFLTSSLRSRSRFAWLASPPFHGWDLGLRGRWMAVAPVCSELAWPQTCRLILKGNRINLIWIIRFGCKRFRILVAFGLCLFPTVFTNLLWVKQSYSSSMAWSLEA